jgi:zinc protease
MKKITTLIAAFGAVLFSLSASAGVRIEHWVAPSGARVYFVETRVLPILDVQIDFSAGSAYEPAGKAGLAGMTVGMLDSGAGSGDEALDEEKISERLVDLAARLAGSSDHDRASLTLRTLTSSPEKEGALDLMRLVLTQPTFPAEPLAREKARSIAGIREAETKPDSIAAKRFAAAIYPGHAYGRSATVESVSAIRRDDLVAFHRDHFSANRAVVSIIGNVSRTEAEAIAQRLTEALPKGSPLQALPPVPAPKAETVKVAHPATQAHIHVGLPAVKRSDPDYYALLVGNYSLGGGGFVSRLMKEVREKRGYAYSVYSYLAPRVLEGPFEMGMQTRRDQAGAALKVANDVLAGFLADGPTAEELTAAKKNLIDGFGLRFDSNAKLLGYLSAIGFHKLPLTYLDDFPGNIERVTAADVKAAFARHVKPEHLVTVIVAGD